MPDQSCRDRWRDQIAEVVDRYSPDLIWFDFCLKFIRDDYGLRGEGNRQP